MKEEASEYLQPNTLTDLVTKYSQFIQFNIYLWESEKQKVEEPVDEDDFATSEEDKPDTAESADDDEEAAVEEEKEDKPKTKTVEKTVWDWKLVNGNKPIWTRKYVRT